MNKLRPRRMVGKPGLFGIVCASALLAACFFLPDETFGVRTPYFFSGFIIAGCFLWAALRR